MKKLLLLIVLLGCEQPQLYKYQIVITSPAGKIKTYEVWSCSKPIPVPNGGTICFRDRSTSYYHQWERDVIAPVGWEFEVRELSEQE